MAVGSGLSSQAMYTCTYHRYRDYGTYQASEWNPAIYRNATYHGCYMYKVRGLDECVYLKLLLIGYSIRVLNKQKAPIDYSVVMLNILLYIFDKFMNWWSICLHMQIRWSNGCERYDLDYIIISSIIDPLSAKHDNSLIHSQPWFYNIFCYSKLS